VSESPEATVMIATRNRREEVLRAIVSAAAQDARVEIIVTDDASTDGTAEAIERSHPDVRLIRSDAPRGALVHRNAMAAAATAPILISLDDDAELMSPRTVAQAIAEFDHPRIAAVCIPFFDAPFPSRVIRRAPREPGRYLTDYFLGCMAAIRRDAFLAAGGYDPILEHSGEEPDICARWLARGWVVRLGSADVGVHHRSAKRSTAYALEYATRNQFAYAIRHVPMPALLWQLLLRASFSFLRIVRHGAPSPVLRGFLAALRHRDAREPLDRRIYRIVWRLELDRLRNRPRIRLEELEPRLPPMQPMDGSGQSMAALNSNVT
jgi:GT2 family glycosyltransferase